MRRNKLFSEEAVSMILGVWVLGVEGFVGTSQAEELCLALACRHHKQFVMDPEGIISASPGPDK